MFTVFNYWFVIELVQWVSALVSQLLKGSVECECCGKQCLLAGCKWCLCSRFVSTSGLLQ